MRNHYPHKSLFPRYLLKTIVIFIFNLNDETELFPIKNEELLKFTNVKIIFISYIQRT